MHIIEKWVNIVDEDLSCFKNKDTTISRLMSVYDLGTLFMKEVAGGNGVVACFIFEDFFGNKTCAELIVYLKPEYRGNFRQFIKMVGIIERIAEENGCNRIQLGATIGYKDDSVLNAYKRLGYKTMGVCKNV